MGGFYVSDDEIEDRALFLREVAVNLVESEILPDKEIVLRPGRIDLATRGYFLLNEAYKKWRITDAHYTQEPKIAALKCMAIATFQPFLTIDPNNATTIAQARANEIYAVAVASTILKHPISPVDSVKRDFWLRLLDILEKAQSQTLEPYRVDINMQISRSLADYKLEISHKDDFLMINSLICIFEGVAGKIS